MNPIPVSWCVCGALAAAALGAWGGWTVRDWKRDSEVLQGVADAARKLDGAREIVDSAAAAYEKDRADAVTNSTLRESTIREIYRDRPVRGDCAAPDAAAAVLQDAVRDANARASGKPSSALPGPAPTAGSSERP